VPAAAFLPAYSLLVAISLAKNTVENEPSPRIFPKMKSAGDVFRLGSPEAGLLLAWKNYTAL